MNKQLSIFVAILALIGLWVFSGVHNNNAQDMLGSGIDISKAMSDEIEGFARAFTPRAFVFPQDHGPHSDYKTEWWYLTGNLETDTGRRFGFQWTLFRIGLAPKKTERASSWGTTEVYMGHFALTDVDNQQFYRFEKFSRAALGLAGAEANPFQVWLENWRIESQGNDFLPLTLTAEDDGISLQITMESRKPIVLQGDRGLSQKSSEAGNASYYYSMTRLNTQGSIRIKDETFSVRGNSWLDREWSSSALGKEQDGWDWFALQLSDGRDLMFYQLRRKDGTMDPHSSGVLVAVDGGVTPLKRDDVKLTTLKTWRSPESGIQYPIRWRMEIKKYRLVLEVNAIQANQEMLLSARYWEGAVDVTGTSNNASLTGRGYLELAGYDANH